MEEEFIVPLHLDGVLETEAAEVRYVAREVEVAAINGDHEDSLEDVASRLAAGGPQEITAHENFDLLYTVLRHFDSVHGRVRTKLLETCCSLVCQMVQVLTGPAEERGDGPVLRNALRMSVFLLAWAIRRADRITMDTVGLSVAATPRKGGTSKSRKNQPASDASWDYELFRERALVILLQVLDSDFASLFHMGVPEENFVGLFTHTACAILQNPANTRHRGARACVLRLLAVPVQRYGQTTNVTSALVEMIWKYEHLRSPITEFLEELYGEYGQPQVVGSIIREIARMNSKETAGIKNASDFLCDVAEKLPQVMLPNISLLIPNLESESYTLRSSIVHVIGRLARHLLTSEASEDGNLRSRDALLEVLEQRHRDVNAFTRSKVLQTWTYLCEERAIPVKRFAHVAEIAVERLIDKAALVRKSALQLLSMLLQYNPYGSKLPLSSFLHNQAEHSEKSNQLTPLHGPNDDDNNNNDNNNNDDEEEEEEPPVNPVTVSTRVVDEFYASAVEFIQMIHEGVSTATQLLGSKNNTDVTEAINFFCGAHLFGIESAETGLRKMLMLVWSSEAGIRDALFDAFQHLYLKTDGHRGEAAEVASRLIGLTDSISSAELASLEEIVTEMTRKRIVSPPVVHHLWETFLERAGKLSVVQRRGALMLLSMIANGDPSIVKNNITVLTSTGLGTPLRNDGVVVRYICIALQKLARAEEHVRLHANHTVVEMLAGIVKSSHLCEDSWFSAAEEALNAIFSLCEEPEIVAGTLLREMTGSLCLEVDGNPTIPCHALSRLFFVVGHTALKEFVHMEDMDKLWRKARSSGHRKVQEDSATEEDHGATQSTQESEHILQIAEKEIVSGNLVGAFLPLVLHVIRTTRYQEYPRLQSTAVLTLCKCMTISSEFCEEQLQLLFSVLQSSQDAEIRANIVITLGDLAFRFPNMLQPWIDHLFARLKDYDTRVRKNTLLVLTHLIMNDMTKVRGQVGDMALCLEDEDQRIADLARIFFHELARKGSNMVYNILPETITRLSSNPTVSQESFRSITKFLVGFIDKEKQTESLIEKLCHRFYATGERKQWADLAYSLSLLNYSERGIRKLTELSKCYKDKLIDEEVHASFRTIVTKAKKFARAETKAALDEFEEKVNNVHSVQVEKPEPIVTTTTSKRPPPSTPIRVSTAAPRARATASRSRVRTQRTKRRRKKEVVEEEEEGPSDQENRLIGQMNATPRRNPGRSMKGRKPILLQALSDGEADEALPV